MHFKASLKTAMVVYLMLIKTLPWDVCVCVCVAGEGGREGAITDVRIGLESTFPHYRVL